MTRRLYSPTEGKFDAVDTISALFLFPLYMYACDIERVSRTAYTLSYSINQSH